MKTTLFSSLLCLLSASLSLATSTSQHQNDEAPAANVIFIMLDDLGRADISAFGSEWNTPNIDSFISESVTLSHHYIGYVCSASRSQFLTGRYSFHNGYGALDVFDLEKVGALPFGTPTIAEYLKFYGDYSTYAFGKWMLGNANEASLAVHRGFDYFMGFNGGMEDYYTKIYVKDGDYLDFFVNDEPSFDYSSDYSTDQYFDAMISTIDKHISNKNTHNTPFFIYGALQATHGPYALDSEYYDKCLSDYNVADIGTVSKRIGVCESLLGVDAGMGKLLTYLKSSEVNKNRDVWDNTVIIFTSDNGGGLGTGNCNYPFRGGKNTYFEGNQRVLAVVGGGKLPDTQQGIILDGLVSNVDWYPTILSFANLIDKDVKYLSIGNNGLQLDGFNMYDYIMTPNSEPIRDHIMFTIIPKLEDNKFTKDIHDYTLDDMDEIGMIFYDNDGQLWKYFDVTESTNPIGNPTLNSGWCLKEDSESESGSSVFTLDANSSDSSYVVLLGLFNVDTDIDERDNYLTDSLTFNDINSELQSIINEKISFYVNSDGEGSGSSDLLYGLFSCFINGVKHKAKAKKYASLHNAWVPFLDYTEYYAALVDDCSIDEEHPMFKLHRMPFEFSKTQLVNDMTSKIEAINPRTKITQARTLNIDVNSLDLPANNVKIHNKHRMNSSPYGTFIYYASFIIFLAILAAFISGRKLTLMKINGKKYSSIIDETNNMNYQTI